jgi:hypothetical protein
MSISENGRPRHTNRLFILESVKDLAKKTARAELEFSVIFILTLCLKD